MKLKFHLARHDTMLGETSIVVSCRAKWNLGLAVHVSAVWPKRTCMLNIQGGPKK